MENIAERFLRSAHRRMPAVENRQYHMTPRPNQHKDATNKLSDYQDLLMDPQSLQGVNELRASLPLPFTPPGLNDRLIANKLDPARRMIVEKTKYKKKFQKALNYYEIPKSEIERVSNLMENKNEFEMSRSLVSLVELASEDPHPYFDADYNYLHGNTIVFSELNDTMFIIYPGSGGNINAAVPEYTDDFCWSREPHQAKHSLDENEPILDIDISGRFMLIRQKKSCGLYKLKSRKKFKLQDVCSVTSNDIYIASCLNKFTKMEFAALSPDFTVDIHDAAGALIRSWQSPVAKNDHWGHLHYNDENTLAYCDRKSFTLLDTRDPSTGSSLWDIQSHTERCEDVFSATKGLRLHYVSTKHHLLSLDIRKGWYQKWSHSLPRSPCLLSAVQKQMWNDTLLLGSQDGGIVCVQNSNSDKFDVTFALSMPYKLPSPIDTLHRARTLGRCLSPFVSPRFSMSLLGVTAYKTYDEINVFFVNSVNDVFTQVISPVEDNQPHTFPLIDAELKHLDDWADRCCADYEQSRRPLECRDTYSCENYVQHFEYPPKNVMESESEPVSLSSQSWARSKKYLTSCVDVLAPKLLSVWKVDDEDEWFSGSDLDLRSKSSTDESDDESESLEKRVMDWLQEMEQIENGKEDAPLSPSTSFENS